MADLFEYLFIFWLNGHLLAEQALYSKQSPKGNEIIVRDSDYFRPRTLIGGGDKEFAFWVQFGSVCTKTERKEKGERDRPPNFARGGNYVAASCRDAIIIGH